MANKTRMIRKPRKTHKQKQEPGLQERLKRLSDSAPVAKLRGGKAGFYDDDCMSIIFKDE